MGYLFLSALCFLLVYGIFRVVKILEDKSREHGLYYSFAPLFAHFAVPILVPVILLAVAAGVVCLYLALTK